MAVASAVLKIFAFYRPYNQLLISFIGIVTKHHSHWLLKRTVNICLFCGPTPLVYHQSNYDLRVQKFRGLLGNKIDRNYDTLGITRN